MQKLFHTFPLQSVDPTAPLNSTLAYLIVSGRLTRYQNYGRVTLKGVLCSATNVPQTRNNPQIGLQVIPQENEKWQGIFVPGVKVSIFNINKSKSYLTTCIFYIDILNSYDEEFSGSITVKANGLPCNWFLYKSNHNIS